MKRPVSRPEKWLWLTMAVPDPANNGQFLYSKGLVEAAASAGLDLDIIALERADGRNEPAHLDGQHWWIAHDRQRSRWESAASTLPHIANRANTPAMRRLLAERLQSHDDWDAIAFDSLAAAWGARQVLAYLAKLPTRPRLIYIAHNHETSLARRIVEIHPHPLKRQVNRVDAVKVQRLERLVSRHADLITANSPEDCALFAAEYPGKRVECLHPVFLGTPVAMRRIDRRVPRRAVIVGSYDWLPKRVNLIEFLRVADPLFAAAGVELLVVGGADRAFLDGLSRTTRATRFTGPVADARPFLADARIGIAAERVGGGFKMKTLDYVFHRVPLAALAGTIPGLPVRDGRSALICPDASLLARRIVGVIDDFDTLNRMQTLAYKASSGVFALANAARLLRRAAAGPDPVTQPFTVLAPAAAV
ncbi:MAG: glycosyltransferase family 4 protein [Alphaproteobacteria bacterium]|nr:glycosyltransferase family 4 protein [Alphaproteobacteria bacterium]